MSESEKHSLKYSIIFDTQTLIFGNPFRTQVINFIKSYQKNEDVEIVYYIPRVVAEEFKSKLPQRIKDAKSAYGDALRQINGLMVNKIPEQELFFFDEEIIKAGEKALEVYGLTILDTPSIGLQQLLKKAINHEPPFKSEGDSGFKDAVIAETVKEHSPGLSNTSKVIFICFDENFRKFMKTIAEEYKFQVYQSIEEFESELKLSILFAGGREKLIDSLQEAAEEIFFKNEDKKSLFYKEAWGRINREFPALFSNPQPRPSLMTVSAYGVSAEDGELGPWISSGKAKYDVYKPLYIGKQDSETLIWESIVSYNQDFIREVSSSTKGLEGFSFTAKRGTYSLKFKIAWTVKLTKEGKLDPNTAEVTSVDQIRDTFNLSWEYSPEMPISGPTTLSGTATITNFEDMDRD